MLRFAQQLRLHNPFYNWDSKTRAAFVMSTQITSSSARLLSLDVYRGAVMLFLAMSGFGLAELSKDTDSGFLDYLGYHATHAAWENPIYVIGLSLWDMIQPAFMFIVGVAVPFSFAKRQSLGDSRLKILRHGMARAVLLVLLGVFLQSTRAKETNWLFTNVLCQIGLGYGLLLMLAERTYRTQFIVGTVILIFSWLIYAFYPVVASTAEGEAVLSGFFGHWSIHNNAGAAFDRWFLNLFPRSEPFEMHPGGYHTINFIPASVTMLLGLMCGQLLRDDRYEACAKLNRLLIGGAACLLLGVLLGVTLCPVVKRLWTPSWVFFSGAYAIWLLAFFYWLVDVQGWKFWTLPFVVVGMNPLAMYVMNSTLRRWFITQSYIHLPDFLFPKPWNDVIEAILAGTIMWLVCYWMYRRKIFLRL